MLAPDPTPLVHAIERHFRDLLEAAPDAMVIVGAAGEILLVNRQTEVLFGYERQDLLGEPVESLIPERFRDGHQRHRADYGRNAQLRPMGTGVDLYARRSDGSEFPTEISLSPVDTEQGRFVIAAIRDVTDRKRAEGERLELLERERAARLAAEQATAARDDVMSVVSHDLQNLLNAMSLNLAVLLRTPVATEAEKRMRHCGEVVDRSVGAIVRLLRDILEAQRMDSTPLQVALSPQPIAGLVQETADLMAALAADKRIRLDLRLEAAPGQASFDRERMQQVLQNLVGNAIHFTPAGGAVSIRVWGEAEGVRISVADSGPGIPADQQAHVFDRYWRGRGASRHGIGLGLFIVKRLVDAHGGRIWVEDTPGAGATFVFTLSR